MSFNSGGRPPDCGAPKASGSSRHMRSMRSVMAAEASQPTMTNPTMFVPGAGGQHRLHHGYLNNVQFDSGDCRGSAAPSGYGSLYSSGGGQAAAGGIHYSYNEYEQLGRSDLHLYPLGDRSMEMQQRQQQHHHHHPAAPASLYEQNSVHAPSMCLLPAPSPHDHHVHAQLHSRPGQQLSLHDQTEELEAGSSVALALQLQAAGTGANHHVRVEQTRTNYNIMQAGRSTGGAVIKESSSDKHAGARTANAVEVMQEDGEEEVEEEGEELIAGEEEMQGRLVQAMENVNGKLQVVAEAAAAMGSCSSYGEQGGPGMSMKKRRLTSEQVRSLEVSFGRESKLEPERKNELAQELGLQPRQVAVWFQNRRARSKTKQLERDFDLLKLQFHAVRSEKEKLQAQVARLKALLDAQMAARKGNTPTTSSEKEAMDEDTITQSLTQHNKTVIESIIGDKKKIREASEEQEGTPVIVPQCMKVFKGDNTQPAHMQAFEADKGPIKGPITLEVKPSLQVPHIDHHHHMYPQQQNYFSHTLSPPTKLSLSTPQKLLHDMVSMKMEEGNLQPSHHERPYIHTQHHHLNAHDDEGYRNDSIICFHPTWHHDS